MRNQPRSFCCSANYAYYSGESCSNNYFKVAVNFICLMQAGDFLGQIYYSFVAKYLEWVDHSSILALTPGSSPPTLFPCAIRQISSELQGNLITWACPIISVCIFDFVHFRMRQEQRSEGSEQFPSSRGLVTPTVRFA